jgi:hypothetical protein
MVLLLGCCFTDVTCVDLASIDRLDPSLLRRLLQCHPGRHVAVLRHCHGAHVQLRAATHVRLGQSEPVLVGVRRVMVQADVLHGALVSVAPQLFATAPVDRAPPPVCLQVVGCLTHRHPPYNWRSAPLLRGPCTRRGGSSWRARSGCIQHLGRARRTSAQPSDAPPWRQ